MDSLKAKFNSFFEEYKKLPLLEKEFLFSQMTNALLTTEFSSQHCINTFKSMHSITRQHKINLNQADIMEIGSGKYSLFTGILWKTLHINQFTGIDKYCQPFTDDNWKDIYKKRFEAFPLPYSDIHRLFSHNDWNELSRNISIYKGDYCDIQLPENQYDFVYSMAVFEHLEKPLDTVEKMYLSLKKGGFSYHNIDLRPHEAGKESPLPILTVSEEQWQAEKKNQNNWIYLNRLRSSDWIEIFRNAGFEVVKAQTRNFENMITEQNSAQLAEKFRKYDINTLNHAILYITLKK